MRVPVAQSFVVAEQAKRFSSLEERSFDFECVRRVRRCCRWRIGWVFEQDALERLGVESVFKKGRVIPGIDEQDFVRGEGSEVDDAVTAGVKGQRTVFVAKEVIIDDVCVRYVAEREFEGQLPKVVIEILQRKRAVGLVMAENLVIAGEVQGLAGAGVKADSKSEFHASVTTLR